MSESDLEKFCAHVLNDPTLQSQLRDVSDVERFFEICVTLGNQHGLQFTREEIRDALRASRHRWQKERWL